jgi:hypothetical protein
LREEAVRSSSRTAQKTWSRGKTAEGFALNNQVDIAISTSSFRSVRGRPILYAIFDEVAFWRDENSASPDDEVYTAIRPGTASIRESMIIGISSPYRKSGLLYSKFKKQRFPPPSGRRWSANSRRPSCRLPRSAQSADRRLPIAARRLGSNRN